MKKKIIIIICSLLVLLVGTLLIIKMQKLKKKDNNGLKEVKVAEVAHTIFYAPMYAAISKDYFKDENINTYSPTIYRRQVSYCFQQPSLFGETVKENLEFPFKIRKQQPGQDKMEQALKSVDLKPDFLNKNITELSGGEKQRVALIRNLLFKPEVLLLDEITTGLDNNSKEIVHHLIQNVHQDNTTIIQVTHDNDEIHQAGQIIRVAEGKLVK